jgi:hypothetical protein
MILSQTVSQTSLHNLSSGTGRNERHRRRYHPSVYELVQRLSIRLVRCRGILETLRGAGQRLRQRTEYAPADKQVEASGEMFLTPEAYLPVLSGAFRKNRIVDFGQFGVGAIYGHAPSHASFQSGYLSSTPAVSPVFGLTKGSRPQAWQITPSYVSPSSEFALQSSSPSIRNGTETGA